MTRDELLPIIKAMKTYGGSFLAALANTMYLADHDNLARLEKAFPEYIETYKEFVSYPQTTTSKK